MCTVLWGISRTRQEFSLPSIFERAKTWLKNRPKFRSRVVSGTAEIHLAPLTLSARGEAAYVIAGTIEDRVATLEKLVAEERSRLNAVDDKIDESARRQEHALADERSRREIDIGKLNEKFTMAHTGGLLVSLAGAMLLVAGTVLSTASQELAALLR